jgi:hypothetical protein
VVQEITEKPVNTFVGGLITEASPLNFPENASVDESNCDLKRSGVRSRRNGIEYETGFTLSSFTSTQGKLVHELTWENVSKESGVEFLVVQIGATHSAGNGKTIADHKISGSSINGFFVVASAAIETVYIEYNSTADTITATKIVPRVRDFEWQGDTSTYSAEIADASVSEGRKYDTYNSGWVTTLAGNNVLPAYSTSAWPPLTHPWFSGKDSSDKFDKNTWRRIYGGNSLIGAGHFILELYNKDRSAAVAADPNISGVVTLTAEVEAARFSAVASFAGRIWLSGLESSKNGSKVFFSKVIEGTDDFNKFLQEADPTSENISDLVDSDGGVINIPSATKIVALFEWGSSILVFAENGVWEIKGVDSVFKATEFVVSRVRGADGLSNSSTLVGVEGTPIWWGNTGIFSLGREEISQGAEGSDISKTTIQTFWEDIGASFRAEAKGAYDALNKRVFWLYGNDAATPYKYNKVLILDVALQAFVPWTISDETSSTNYIVGMSYFSGLGAEDQILDVVSNSGVDDVISGVDDVIISQTVALFNDQTEIRFLVRDGSTGKLTFATFSNTGFLDWDTEDYSSYAVAAYDFVGDLTLRKSNVYITTYFDLTETGFTGNETTGYAFLNPSSCILKSFWDLKNVATSSRQVYRHLRPIVVDTGDLTSFDYPSDSIITRNRIRGRGRVLKLRFESEQGKDFQLQGYGVTNARNTSL